MGQSEGREAIVCRHNPRPPRVVFAGGRGIVAVTRVICPAGRASPATSRTRAALQCGSLPVVVRISAADTGKSCSWVMGLALCLASVCPTAWQPVTRFCRFLSSDELLVREATRCSKSSRQVMTPEATPRLMVTWGGYAGVRGRDFQLFHTPSQAVGRLHGIFIVEAHSRI